MSYRNFSIDTRIPYYHQNVGAWKSEPCFGYDVETAGCSLVCTAMCVDETPQTLIDDGWGNTSGGMQWKQAVKDYGYRIDTSIDYDLYELFNALNDRKAPIIVRVNSPSVSGMHFVVIAEFRGKLSYDPQGGYYGFEKSMFKVYDPWKERGENQYTIKDLSEYTGIKVIGQVY